MIGSPASGDNCRDDRRAGRERRVAKYGSVDEYMAALPEERRTVMEQLRRTIRAAAPQATEAIAYNMPAFRVDGRFLVSYEAFKHHYSLFPWSDRMLEELGEALQPYAVGKGTIRFAADEPIPLELVTRIVEIRNLEVAAEAGCGKWPAEKRLTSASLEITGYVRTTRRMRSYLRQSPSEFRAPSVQAPICPSNAWGVVMLAKQTTDADMALSIWGGANAFREELRNAKFPWRKRRDWEVQIGSAQHSEMRTVLVTLLRPKKAFRRYGLARSNHPTPIGS